MIISFAWTTPALLAGRKTATSRKWSAAYLRRMQKAYDLGDRRHQAWNKLPHAGGCQVGWLTLTKRPVEKRIMHYTSEEVRAEGLNLRTPREFQEWMREAGHSGDEMFTLVRFVFEPLEPGQESLDL